MEASMSVPFSMITLVVIQLRLQGSKHRCQDTGLLQPIPEQPKAGFIRDGFLQGDPPETAEKTSDH